MSDPVLENVMTVAQCLQEVGVEDAVFVGGATVGLLLTDPAAPEARPTLDVDVVTPVASRRAFNILEAKLREAGYTQPLGEPICRWVIAGVTVDLMPPDEAILGFSNRWYGDLVEHAEPRALPNGTLIQLVSTPYLVATKLEAFRGRGQEDYRFSHDLEDIIILFDGREEVVGEIERALDDVRTYIVSEFRRLLGDTEFLEAVPEHLAPDAASQARASVILERMRRLLVL